MIDEEYLKTVEDDITDNRYCDEDVARELIEEVRRLRKALERISNGMDIVPFNDSLAQVEGYFRGYAEAILKGTR